MYRLLGKALPLVGIVLLVAGCGGGGALTDTGRSYKGSLEFELGGGVSGLDVTTAIVTATKLELMDAASGDYRTLWSGSRQVDLLSSSPQKFSSEVDFGDDTSGDYNAIRVTLSHVHLVDDELGTWDEDVDWTLEFPLEMRLLAGRKALLRAILPLAAFELQDEALVLNETTVHQANGTDSGVLEPRWVDAVYLDLSHLPYEIPMPNGKNATGIWFSNDNLGFFVDDADGQGGEFYSWYDGEFELGGTYEYDNPQKSTLTWYVQDPNGLLTGTAYALRTVCPLKANGWNGLVMGGGKAEHGVFILAKTDANKNIVDIYGGDIVLNSEDDPMQGGTAEMTSLYDLLNATENPFQAAATLTYDGKISGTYSFESEHSTLPASGNWTLYLPGG